MWFKGVFLAVVSGYLAYELNDRELSNTWDFWLLYASIGFGIVSVVVCLCAAIKDLFGVELEHEH